MASYRDERIKAEYSTNTIRLELAIISHLFEIARKEWGMEGLTNPVKSIRLPSPPSGRDRRLQPGELEKLLECLSEEMGQVVRFALETAMRRGELAGMTWEMVDLKKRTVTFPETKNGQKRIVPLSSVAASILKDRLSTRRIDGEVWNIGLDAISQDFARACHKAGISGMRRAAGFLRRVMVLFLSAIFLVIPAHACFHGEADPPGPFPRTGIPGAFPTLPVEAYSPGLMEWTADEWISRGF